jgi:hypothetical protein
MMARRSSQWSSHYLFLVQVLLATLLAWRGIGIGIIYCPESGLDIITDCRPQYPSCRTLYKQNPTRSMDCHNNSSLTSSTICSTKCYDTPPALERLEMTKDLPQVWPPIGEGKWIRDEDYCRNKQSLYPCLMNKYRWKVDDFEPLSNPCKLLHQHNISDIHAIGDYLIRQVTQALVILLNDNYDYRFNNRRCVGDSAFSELSCRREIYKEYRVCYLYKKKRYEYITVRAIRFSYQHQHLLDIIYPGEGPGNTLYLYGVGLHPSDPKKEGAKWYTQEERQTILNTSAYVRDKWKEMDEPYFYGRSNYLVWIPPHFKLAIPREDQTNEKSFQFFQESSDFFAQSKAATLNTFGMTHAAAEQFRVQCEDGKEDCKYLEAETCQPTRETYDGSHYSRNINLVKGQLLLYQWNQMAEKRANGIE